MLVRQPPDGAHSQIWANSSSRSGFSFVQHTALLPIDKINSSYCLTKVQTFGSTKSGPSYQLRLNILSLVTWSSPWSSIMTIIIIITSISSATSYNSFTTLSNIPKLWFQDRWNENLDSGKFNWKCGRRRSRGASVQPWASEQTEWWWKLSTCFLQRETQRHDRNNGNIDSPTFLFLRQAHGSPHMLIAQPGCLPLSGALYAIYVLLYHHQKSICSLGCELFTWGVAPAFSIIGTFL